eukprot:1196180-Prorocentrum_minimum.AAC.7
MASMRHSNTSPLQLMSVTLPLCPFKTCVSTLLAYVEYTCATRAHANHRMSTPAQHGRMPTIG